MSYATEADLVARHGSALLIQLADRDGSGAADPDVIAAALASADALIDSYLSGRYAVPIAAPPPLIRDIAVDLAWHALHSTAVTEVIQAAYDRALARLRDIQAGKARLDVALAAVAATALVEVRVVAPDRIFTRRGMAEL